MLHSIKNRENLENLNEVVSLKNQVEDLRLQDKLSKQNFHEDMKKLCEAHTDKIKYTSQKLTKTVTENYIGNNEAISDLNEKVLEIMNDKSMKASYLASSVVNQFTLEKKVILKI